jgi:hypothetical protein
MYWRWGASGLSWGCSSEIDASGRVLYTADAYRADGKRFPVRGRDLDTSQADEGANCLST